MRWDSAEIRSISMGVLAACPTDDLAPLIARTAKRRREKVKQHGILTSTEFCCR